MNCGKVIMEITTDMREAVDKRYTELLTTLQSTLAIGDYEDLFFKFLEALKNQTHWHFFEMHLLALQNTYDAVIEDIYG
jgi:hypothetical protein